MNTRKAILSSLLLSFLLSDSSVAQVAPPPATAPAAPVPCARNPDVGSVKGILKSNDGAETKARLLTIAAQNSVINGWASISRPDDVGNIIGEISQVYLTKFGSPIPEKDLDANAATLSTAIGDALNAVCVLADQDTAKLKAAAFAAAKLDIAEAAPAVADAKAVEVKSSGDAYGTGDRLRFYTETDGFRLVKDDLPTTPAIAPCGSKFRITGVDAAGENVIGYFYEVPKIDAKTRPTVGNRIARFFRKEECGEDLVAKDRVIKSKRYQISAESLAGAPAYTSGFEFGVLVAPYKFHFDDDSMTPSATVGPYFGFRFGNPAVSISPVLSVGFGAVTETDPETPEGATEPAKPGTLASLSAAAGVLFTIRKAGGFTVGLLLGTDYTGEEERYRYDGEIWAALSVGLTLTE